jgi:hypothetical protein
MAVADIDGSRSKWCRALLAPGTLLALIKLRWARAKTPNVDGTMKGKGARMCSGGTCFYW